MAAGTIARGEGNDADQIRHLMQATWETASTPLSVDPVVVRADYAIAGWVQDQRGGRALLRKAHSKWEVILCAGDHLRAADTLTAAGVPAGAAEQLVAGLHKAEAALPRETLLRFSQLRQRPAHGRRVASPQMNLSGPSSLPRQNENAAHTHSTETKLRGQSDALSPRLSDWKQFRESLHTLMNFQSWISAPNIKEEMRARREERKGGGTKRVGKHRTGNVQK